METKYVLFKNKAVRIEKFMDGLWRDCSGTIWALADDTASVDPRTRCGIGVFSLPEGVGECRGHDFAFSSPYYQLAHTRLEADQMLRRMNPGLLGKIFYRLSRLFGGKFWENKETR